MTILQQLNSPAMYAICGGIVGFVAIICVVFLVRAYRIGKAIGMDTGKMKQVIVSSATFSLLPSVGILLGVIALAGSLGTPWPWLRLSVIGALHYETQVAQAAAEQVGMHSLSISEMTPSGFATITLLMSLCIIWGMVLTVLFNKRYTQKLTQRTGAGGGFGDMAMTAMFIGMVSVYLASYIGNYISAGGLLTFRGDWIPLLTALVSALTMGLLMWLSRKGHGWLENFSIALSMLLGMAAAALAAAL